MNNNGFDFENDFEVVGVVYKTRMNNLFKPMKGNRDIKEQNIKHLENSIDSIGYVPSKHIIVNEKFEIVDGQHRFKACKNLDLPIYFMCNPGLDLKIVKMLNKNQLNWSLKNHINSNAEVDVNKDSYIRIKNIMSKYGITTSVLQCPAILRCNKNSLSNGGSVFTEEDFTNASKTLDYVFSVIDLCGGRTVVGRSCNRDAFIRTLAYLYCIDEIDNEKLKLAAVSFIRNSVDASRISQVAKGIEEFYYGNSKTRKLGRIHFNDYIDSFNTYMSSRVRSEAGKRRFTKSK